MPFDTQPRPEQAAILTVSALNQAASRILERTFPALWIQGEVSNFTRASSGHWYFTLKDDTAQVRSVMFKGRSQYVDFIPREGDRIEVRGTVTLYAPRGDYQLNIDTMRRAGTGNLYEAFLQLKNKLEREGLFSPEHKKAIPPFAHTVGVVSSPQAAALRDILTTLQRRSPHVQVILYPTPVQGEGSAQKIAQAITTASNRQECDVLLVCRGGGSIEDLWSFNEEVVARAVAACQIPVISGVGHETDFTICDFVADLRAPTPTAAAELAATSYVDLMSQIYTYAKELQLNFDRQFAQRSQTIDLLAHRLINPSAYVRQERAKLQNTLLRLSHGIKNQQNQYRYQLQQRYNRVTRLIQNTDKPRMQLTSQWQRLTQAYQQQYKQLRININHISSRLNAMGPQQTLNRGYAILTDYQGHVIHSPNALQAKQALHVRLAKGSADLTIQSVQAALPENE